MRIAPLASAAIAVAGIFVIGTSLGCSDSNSKPVSIASEERVDQLVEMRKLFDKAGGKWDSLSAEEKAEYNKLAGSEEKGRAMWETMSTPAGGAPTG